MKENRCHNFFPEFINCICRNLVIPSQNKAVVLEDGLVDIVYPMLAIPTFPVVFKLLGTLRMVIDGQGELRMLGNSHLHITTRNNSNLFHPSSHLTIHQKGPRYFGIYNTLL